MANAPPSTFIASEACSPSPIHASADLPGDLTTVACETYKQLRLRPIPRQYRIFVFSSACLLCFPSPYPPVCCTPRLPSTVVPLRFTDCAKHNHRVTESSCSSSASIVAVLPVLLTFTTAVAHQLPILNDPAAAQNGASQTHHQGDREVDGRAVSFIVLYVVVWSNICPVSQVLAPFLMRIT